MKFALRNLGWTDPFALPPYEIRLFLLEMDSLSNRNGAAEVLFVVKLLTGRINVPQLHDKVVLNMNPFGTRRRHQFAVDIQSTNHGNIEPVTRCLSALNL